MAKEVIWSRSASVNKLKIYRYWTTRLRSNEYCRKLDMRFREVADMISHQAFVGYTVRDRDARGYTVGQYIVFYRVHGEHIRILRVWDSRRNPDDLILE